MAQSRREFITNAAGATVGAIMATKASAAGANDRLGLGFIGCGGRGNSLLSDCLKSKDKLNLAFPAICDVWQVNLESTAAKIEKETGTRPKTFTRYEELLALPEIDAVFIATPDFAHSPILADAAKAKKHAYVEKPMAVRLKDAKDAVDAVVENGIVCQVGTQRRSDGRYIAAAEHIQGGALGKLVKCDCAWHDNGPRWKRDFSNVKQEDVDWEQYLMYLPKCDFDPRMFRLWHLYKECSVGLVGLLGSHFIDVIVWYTGDPFPQYSVGMGENIVWTERENTDTQECLFYYPKGFVLQYSSRLGNSKRLADIAMFGTNGTFDTTSWTISGEGGGANSIKEPIKIEPVPTTGHITNWIECIRANDVNTRADVHAGYAHAVASIMGSLACDTGRRLVYNPKKRKIIKG